MSARTRASEPPRPASAAPSERVQLARLALDAALGVDGVVSSHAGPLGTRVTADREERLPGVLATALAGGGYGVELHLVTEVVPLPPLADRVRSRVERAASSAGLADVLGPVDITIEDVVMPNEVSKR
jgi:hypothetical protein